MRRKKASEIFAAVDPHLKVIDGGRRRKRKKRELTEWEKAGGVFCPACREETVRILRGVCPSCFKKLDAERIEKLAVQSKKRYYWGELQAGRITLSQMKKGTR